MDSREAADFGKVAVALGFLTKEDVEKAVRFQGDMEKLGVRKRLGELLLERKILTRDQVLLVLRAQGKRILACPKCEKSYNIHHYRPSETYTCKHCQGALVVPAGNTGKNTRVNDSIIISTTELEGRKGEKSKVPKELVHLLNGYEITARVGQGGMGTVYKARDTIMDRWVAVKLLAPFLATDEEYVKRFFREARNLQKLDHPNIVTAYDAGIAGEHKFLIMEFVEGPNLEKVLEKRGRLPERAALEIVRQVAEALDYAWQRRIIHRDVKPLNIMIMRDRHVKLCDLGLSKDVTSDITLTMTGSVNCSPPYASPEMAQGLKKVDCRTDVYSLGVSLFQLATGSLPFSARSPGEYLIAHVTKTPPDPRSKNPAVSEPTAKLILRMLEKSPHERPTPSEVARTLRKSLNGSSRVK